MKMQPRVILFATTIATTAMLIHAARCAAEPPQRSRSAAAPAAQSGRNAHRDPQMLAMAESKCASDRPAPSSIRSASKEALRAGLRDSNACVRKSVVDVIGKSADEAWLEDLRGACKDASAEVRASAAVSLGSVLERARPRGFKDADARFVQSLIGLLEDRSQSVRRAAAKSLQFLSGMELDYSPGYWKAWWEDGVSLRTKG